MNILLVESQIVPVEIPQKKGEPVVIRRDESPRRGFHARSAREAQAAFKKGRHGRPPATRPAPTTAPRRLS